MAAAAAAAPRRARWTGDRGPPSQSPWYPGRLEKPGFQPPKQAFPIAWNILYTDIAVVSASTI
ncbi:tryptophan-rich sensory protein, partial [Mycobacterium rufum]|nr:tryptophan-rich sensory protein [Mycolicibacterium rufum]